MTARNRPLVLEALERRDTPAYTSTLAGTTATLIGDNATDVLVLTASAGLLVHNRFSSGDPGFASNTDWNTTVAGTQTLAAAAASEVIISTMGGGDDRLQLGAGGSPARNLLAHITISAAGAGNDNLIVDNSGSAVADTYDYTSTQVDAPGLNFTNLANFENGQQYLCGTGADTFNVRSTTQNVLVEGTNGADVVTVGDAGSMDNVLARVTVSNNFGSSSLTLTDTASAAANTVTVNTVGVVTTVAGLAPGSVVYDAPDVLSLSIFTGSGADSFAITNDAANLTALIQSGGGADSFAVNSAGGANADLTLFGGSDNDTFAVNAAPAATFTLVLQGNAGTDTASFASPAGGSPTVTHANATNGTVALAAGSFAVAFETLDGVAVTGTPATVTVNLPASATPAVAVGDDGTAADPDATQNPGVSLVSGSTFAPTAVANPSTGLVVNLGPAGSTVTLTDLDAAFAGTVTLNGGAAADTFNINATGVPVTAAGSAPGTAPGDTLNVGFFVPGATGSVPNGTAGSVTYTGMEAVNLLTFDDREFAAGADVGGGGVRHFNPDGTERFAVAPFGAAFTGGVRVATADFTGDGVADVVVGTGPGGPTRVRVLDGVTQAELFTTDPFEAAFTGGVYVAAGDITGDGVPELVITPDEGGGPRVKVISGAGFTPLADFFGIDDANFRGGARAAVGDIDGDGFGELVVCAGFGGGPRVAAFKGSAAFANNAPKLFNDFFVFEQALRNGAFVAVGDVNADGFGDLIGGGGPGGGPRVLILSGADLTAGKADGSAPLANFFAGDTASRGGIRVSARHLDADATADVVVGAGSGAGSRVTAYLGSALSAEAFGFNAFPGSSAGVFVG